MKFIVRSAANDDVLRQYRFYLIEKGAGSAAQRFLEAVQHAFRQICLHPEIGTPKPLKNRTLAGLRSWPIDGFRATRVYYCVSNDVLRVIRVLHSKRDISPLLEDESGDE
ncbi:MAG: type II toxin-antitoxin system RelE/ParE family toxin [Acidobacteriaceae bacterium]